MKKYAIRFFIGLTLAVFLSIAERAFTQAPPPPPTVKGTDTNKGPGGGAPLDGSVYMMLAMVAGFGTWKLVAFSYKRKHTS